MKLRNRKKDKQITIEFWFENHPKALKSFATYNNMDEWIQVIDSSLVNNPVVYIREIDEN